MAILLTKSTHFKWPPLDLALTTYDSEPGFSPYPLYHQIAQCHLIIKDFIPSYLLDHPSFKGVAVERIAQGVRPQCKTSTNLVKAMILYIGGDN